MKKIIVLLTLMMLGFGTAQAQNNTPLHGWHSYCGGEFNNAIGGPVPFIAAVSYPAEMMADYAGTSITKVAIFSDTLYNAVGGRYTCSVYVGGQANLGGLLVVSDTLDVPQSLNDWAEFDLSTPVSVTGDAAIWIVWKCIQQLTAWPMGVCEGNDPSGNGNWLWNMATSQLEPSLYGDWTVKTYFNWDGPQPQPQDVYIAGNHNGTGKVWKNNSMVYSISDTISVNLNAMEVAADGQVMSAGYVFDTATEFAQGRVWINDSLVFATGDSTIITSLALDGNDWMAGGWRPNEWETIMGLVWQNGQQLYAFNDSILHNQVDAIAIDTATGDIYSAGCSSDSLTLCATVWKNDTMLWREDVSSSIIDMVYDSNDLYAIGNFFLEGIISPALWQNDSVIFSIDCLEDDAYFNALSVYNGSVYVAGWHNDSLVVWQDGEPLYGHVFTNGGDLTALAVNESGVYYGGVIDGIATVWKDGEMLYEVGECESISDLVVKPAPPLPEYTITVESANPEWGSVAGSGTFTEGSETTIYAIPALGCEFLGWNDNITDNPRTVTVTQDSTFVASFGRIEYTINVVSDHPAWGSVTGGGTYYYGDTIVISATANMGFEFLDWGDGNTDNPRTVVVYNDRTYTARFGILQCLIKTDVTPEGAGSVNGGGTYNYGETIHLTAHSNPGYIFDMWEDGNITNPRTVFVEGNATYTAVFSPLQYEITTEADPAEGGTVTGGGTFNYGSTVTLTATANPNYTFICWHDGIVRNPREETVTGNANYRALFHLNGTPQYTITVLANDPTLGTVSGSGTYPQGTTIEISATPLEHSYFRSWNDGNTDNPRTIVVTQDMTFTAFFETEQQYSITVVSGNPLLGTVYGSGTYPANTTVSIGAMANSGCHFTGWQDGNMDNPRTIVVTGNATYTASFAQTPVQTYTITAQYVESQGYVLGAGEYVAGSTARLVAIANDGYVFLAWGDGTTDNPKDIVVDHDITIASFFNGTGIGENGMANVVLYPNPANDKLSIEGLEKTCEVRIYNAYGLHVKTATVGSQAEIAISDLAPGIYLIQFDGGHPMKFVKR